MEVKQEQEVLVKIAEHTEQIKVANRRISDLEETSKRIESLTMSVQKLAFAVEAMAKEQIEDRAKQAELAKRLLEVEQMPFKTKAGFWDKYISQIVSLVVGAVMSFLIYQLMGI